SPRHPCELRALLGPGHDSTGLTTPSKLARPDPNTTTINNATHSTAPYSNPPSSIKRPFLKCTKQVDNALNKASIPAAKGANGQITSMVPPASPPPATTHA